MACFGASSNFEWCGVEEVGSGSFSYVKKSTKSKCRMVVFFIKIYKQVIFQHECIVGPVQSASGKSTTLRMTFSSTKFECTGIFVIVYLCFFLAHLTKCQYCIVGLMVTMLVLSVVDHGFKSYSIGFCCFPAEHAALKRKNKKWLV
jgi:hypothetical protein